MSRKVKVELTQPQVSALLAAIGAVQAGESDGWTAAALNALRRAQETLWNAQEEG